VKKGAFVLDLARLHGIFVPIVTPLTDDERVDHRSLERVIDFLLEGGVHGIWIMGTTGEFACLPEDERARAVETTVTRVAGRVPVVANIGDCSTQLALRHASHALAAGADALALTPPYYYPHTMDEVQAHFRAVKAAVGDRPLLIYNIPQTVKVRMEVMATLQLAMDGTVTGIKDSQNDLQWFRDVMLGAREAGLGDSFRGFLGTRSLIDAGIAIGAHGAIPGIGNIAPAACVATYEAARAGDFVAATRAQELVLRFEALAKVAHGGSATAASLSSMKHVLQAWGIIAQAGVCSPLRGLTRDEVEDLKRRLEGVPFGIAPLADQEPVAV
jgi:4-hydroxy-tetrahydrodipicolinate synthase